MPDHDYVPTSVTPVLGGGRPRTGARRASRTQQATRWGAAVLVAVLVVLGLSWHAIDHRHRGLAAGTVQNVGDSLPTTHKASVLLPWGRLELATTDPRTRLPHDVAVDQVGGDVRPPAGGRFVGVSWAPAHGDNSGALPFLPIRVSPATGSFTDVALVTDGHSYPLAPTSRHGYCSVQSICLGPYGENAAWVAVDGAATDVAISATFAGVTQTVDMTTGHVRRGRASGLYDATTEHRACGTPTWRGGLRGRKQRCSAVVTRSPWVSGLGWAPAGREWVAASVSVDRPYSVVGRARGRTSRYYASGLTATATFELAGGTRVALQPTGADDGALPSTPAEIGTGPVTVAWSVPASGSGSRLVVHATWNLDPAGSRAVRTRATSHATATWTVPA